MQKPIKHFVYKKDYICNPSTCSCEISRYLKAIADDLVISCDEIMEVVTKLCDVSDTESINLTDKKAACKIDNYYILLTFL